MNDITNWAPLEDASDLEGISRNLSVIVDRQLRERTHRIEMQAQIERNTEITVRTDAKVEAVKHDTADIVGFANEMRALQALGNRALPWLKIAAAIVALWGVTVGGCTAYNTYRASQAVEVIAEPE